MICSIWFQFSEFIRVDHVWEGNVAIKAYRVLSVFMILALALAFVPSRQPVQAAAAELFFSEYIEGSSNNKALEIYNGTGAAVDLAAGGYNIQMFFNGSASAGLTISLSGTVSDGDVYVVAHSSAIASILAQADQTNGAGWFNGDDAVVLRKGTTVLDVIGQIGFDPGSEWGSGLVSTADNTLQRAATFCAGDVDGSNVFDPSVEWSGFAQDTVTGLGSHTANCGGTPADAAPTVGSVVPAANALNVLLGANLIVTFSEDVSVPVNAFTLSCTVSGGHSLVVSGGPAVYTLDPDVDFTSGESCTLTVDGALVSDVDVIDPPDTMAENFVSTFTTEVDSCALPATLISAVQGTGDITPLNGQTVNVQGVVTGDFQGSSGLQGFFLQDITPDGNPATSDGVFVFVPSGNPLSSVDVAVGDVVALTGKPKEFNGLTEFDNLTALKVCGQTDVPAPVVIDLPETVNGELEAYEGMYVTIPEPLTVAQNFFQGRYGQVTLAADGRLITPTNVYDAGSPEALALADENARRLIVLDDARSSQNPNPIPYIGADDTLRAGDIVNGVTGLLDFGPINSNSLIRDYRIQPSAPVEITRANPRPTEPPAVGGTIQVAGANVLNYFTTLGSRGANTSVEFERQAAKIVAELVNLDAAVVGLMEIESNGDEAAANLVERLNAATAPGTYAYVSDPVTGVGTDEIKVAIIYQPALVTPYGASISSTDPIFDRAPVMQTFIANNNGAKFSVVVNHFKSKSSCPDSAADPNADQGDGQGCWNLKRVQQAQALLSFIAAAQQQVGDMDVLITGDLNAYAQEDPVQVLLAAGYVDLVDLYNEASYSYVFDGAAGYLDHALASPTLAAQSTGAAHWHINADEPSVIDYNTEFKPQDLYAPDMYRASDHDPVVAGFDLLNYGFQGFLSPVANYPTFNNVNSGQAVPLKFMLNANYGLDVFAPGYPVSAEVACGGSDSINAGQPLNANSWTVKDTQYNFTWKTDKAWKNTCRQVLVVFRDGTIARANFQFVK